MSCPYVRKTNTFTRYETGKKFKFFHQLNCKGSQLIYLLQCRICQLQYVGKSEISFSIRLVLDIDRKYSKKKDPIQAGKHLQNPNHNFQRDAKFTRIE